MSYRSTTRAGLSARRLSQPSVTAAARMTEDEVDAMIDNFAKQDTAREKTWTRIVVERFLSKFLWYFPRRDAKNGPSLSKAYAYYEHITLPRRFVGEHQNADHVLRRAEPGETEGTTELYKALCTPEFALIEFGVGIDLYFSTVKLFAFLLLCAGLIKYVVRDVCVAMLENRPTHLEKFAKHSLLWFFRLFSQWTHGYLVLYAPHIGHLYHGRVGRLRWLYS